VVFLTPQATPEDWALVEERLRSQSRLRILLTRTAEPAARLSLFDEVYRSASREGFNARMTALAGDLFRISTALILVADPGARQFELMREELRRLGLEDDEVEVLQYPRRGSSRGR
jgi:hypothetical protein